MKCLTSELTLETPTPITGTPDKLRGSIASQNINKSIYHQHTDEGLKYRYPLIHYHILDEKAVITGFLEGVDETKKLFQKLNYLQLGKKKHHITGKKLAITEQEFGLTDRTHRYRFVSPWIALNSRNYQKYIGFNGSSRLKFLEKILTGNILSASKSLNYTVEDIIQTSLIYARQIPHKLKGTPILAFQGVFEVNFELPELFGLGKSVSRGFGAIRRI